MEIKIGDYIRTRTGFIRKVKNIYMLGWAKEKDVAVRINGKYKLKDIVKCSKNIIDLIEERRFCKWSISYRSSGRILTYIRWRTENCKIKFVLESI